MRLSVMMNSRMLFHLRLEFFIPQQESRPEINHTKHRSTVICFLLVTMSRFVLKFVVSSLLLSREQRDVIHLTAITFNDLTTELTAVVTFQFIFFSSALLKRFENLAENMRIDFQPRHQEDSIKFYSQRYSMLSVVMQKINATFSIQVCQSFDFC